MRTDNPYFLLMECRDTASGPAGGSPPPALWEPLIAVNDSDARRWAQTKGYDLAHGGEPLAWDDLDRWMEADPGNAERRHYTGAAATKIADLDDQF